jgi:hypothetical protein
LFLILNLLYYKVTSLFSFTFLLLDLFVLLHCAKMEGDKVRERERKNKGKKVQKGRRGGGGNEGGGKEGRREGEMK